MARACPVHAPCARRAVTTAKHGQRTRCSVGLDGVVKHHRQQGRRHSHHLDSSYTLLHPHLNGDGRRGVLTRQRATRWRRSASKRTHGNNSDEDPRAQFLSCTGMPRALEAQRRSLPVMRSDRESSHRWWKDVTRVIRGGRWRNEPMMVKPGAKQPQILWN
jgi:hypothetical protein